MLPEKLTSFERCLDCPVTEKVFLKRYSLQIHSSSLLRFSILTESDDRDEGVTIAGSHVDNSKTISLEISSLKQVAFPQ